MAIFYDYSNPNTLVTDKDAISNSIKNILLTPRGSVPGKPRFGSDLYKVPFELMDHITRDLIRNFIINALNEFEPRISISSVIINDIPEYNRITTEVSYTYNLKGITIQTTTNITIKD